MEHYIISLHIIIPRPLIGFSGMTIRSMHIRNRAQREEFRDVGLLPRAEVRLMIVDKIWRK